jgi:ABC-type nitrate/sulfonate/bicarbonate transport system ATPase subunit
MSNYRISEPVILEIDLELFEYKQGQPILTNIKQKIHNIQRNDVLQGQVVAVLGPSGIGKSTLFELVAGLINPTKGSIKAYDKAKNELVPVDAGMVGMVYQSYDVYPFLSVKGQLELGAKKGNLSGKEAEDKIQYYLEYFRLKEHSNKYPNQLSGGQKQRLAIAQQLLCSNIILLMDEPFSGLDPVIKNDMCHLIAEIAQLDELQTIIIVSHDIEPTLSIADTVWLVGKTPQGGSTIVETINMMDKGLCWQKNIQDSSEFQQMCNYVTKKFMALNG